MPMLVHKVWVTLCQDKLQCHDQFYWISLATGIKPPLLSLSLHHWSILALFIPLSFLLSSNLLHTVKCQWPALKEHSCYRKGIQKIGIYELISHSFCYSLQKENAMSWSVFTAVPWQQAGSLCFRPSDCIIDPFSRYLLPSHFYCPPISSRHEMSVARRLESIPATYRANKMGQRLIELHIHTLFSAP